MADTLVVTKADAAVPADVAALEARLRALNPVAPIRRVSFGAIAPDVLLGRGRGLSRGRSCRRSRGPTTTLTTPATSAPSRSCATSRSTGTRSRCG